MGVLDFTWNAIQSDQIDEIDKKVEALEKDMATARAWIEYLTERINELEKQNENTGCKSCNCQTGRKPNDEKL